MEHLNLWQSKLNKWDVRFYLILLRIHVGPPGPIANDDYLILPVKELLRLDPFSRVLLFSK
jgi:hypothetical protein